MRKMNARLQCPLFLSILLLGGCGSRPDYVAPPFFSEAAFREVRPGLTEDAVRTLLGYPVSRFGPVEVPGQVTKIKWNYTVPASWEPPLRFHCFEVTFGPDGREYQGGPANRSQPGRPQTNQSASAGSGR